jgi:uncharacterized membrane protein YoaT (DUF817 family)
MRSISDFLQLLLAAVLIVVAIWLAYDFGMYSAVWHCDQERAFAFGDDIYECTRRTR